MVLWVWWVSSACDLVPPVVDVFLCFTTTCYVKQIGKCLLISQDLDVDGSLLTPHVSSTQQICNINRRERLLSLDYLSEIVNQMLVWGVRGLMKSFWGEREIYQPVGNLLSAIYFLQCEWVTSYAFVCYYLKKWFVLVCALVFLNGSMYRVHCSFLIYIHYVHLNTTHYEQVDGPCNCVTPVNWSYGWRVILGCEMFCFSVHHGWNFLFLAFWVRPSHYSCLWSISWSTGGRLILQRIGLQSMWGDGHRLLQ